ncbi:TetR/AcrR family transcriptional regulator [Nocardia otitidiscaviarum]|uniref:TetR/AcrR family transcriptional regulator n=1 Tax=Nocardia otitidiscaviarum TaxID=1823 RepID=A0A516NTS9_9NOCA|nr:TetR/AcrR family transcriptional regulator [Nocardia otitidiscaviarum]MCP9621672.1 TetR/AcrR family transcriptional regulator [Nocardia otitidiscaviarum]QDP82327.1 TetR/AcrR family transcriptional regulator [Nocardia otitidiscaviarum]
MTAPAGTRTGPGRPRDPQLDAQVLAAAQELLVTEGYEATTIAAVARRAGVVTTSIYRRWPSRRALIEDAVFALDPGNHPVPTGDLRADLLAWTRLCHGAAAHPAARSAIPGLLAAYHDDRASYRRILDRGEQPTRRALRELLTGAAAAGQASAGCDVDAIFELLRGATLIRALTHGEEGADAFCEQIADALVVVARTPQRSNPNQ